MKMGDTSSNKPLNGSLCLQFLLWKPKCKDYLLGVEYPIWELHYKAVKGTCIIYHMQQRKTDTIFLYPVLPV